MFAFATIKFWFGQDLMGLATAPNPGEIPSPIRNSPSPISNATGIVETQTQRE